MRCDDVAVLLPGAGRRRSPSRRAPCSATSSRACAARPSWPATGGCSAASQLLRTRYLEPAPGLLAQTLAALERGGRAPGRPLDAHRAPPRLRGRDRRGRRGRRPRPPRRSLVARSRRRVASRSPAEPPAPARGDSAGSRHATRLANLDRPAPRARRAVAQLAEHRSPKPAVGGSSPSCPARCRPIDPMQRDRDEQREPTDQAHDGRSRAPTSPRAPERKRPRRSRARRRSASVPGSTSREVRGELRKVAWPTRREVSTPRSSCSSRSS